MSEKTWFEEIWTPEGCSFSLEVQSHLHSEQSAFQKIDIYQTLHWGKLMVLDGCYMVTDRDNFLYHEMMVHPALFTHPSPEKVMVIGGGDCGALKEVLKHPSVKKAYQVEIDQRVTELSEMYFPQLCTSNQDPRAVFYFGDGVQWLKAQAASSLDVIIIDSTDPVGPAAGLFSRDFLKECLRALGANGVLVQQSESPLFHSKTLIKQLHQELAAAGFTSRKTLPFPQPIYPSGWWSCTIASQDLDVNEFRKIDAQHKPFNTEYYNAGIHLGALSTPAFLQRDLDAS